MAEEKVKELEEQIEQFARFFEEGAMTLIAKMAEINDKLDRISSSVEMVDKLRMQSVENKQIMSQVNKGFNNLLRRLDSMSKGGFVIPESPPPGTETKPMDAGLLNAEISVSAIDDDLADLGEAPSMEELQKQFGSGPEPSKVEEKLPPMPEPSKVEKELPPQPELPKIEEKLPPKPEPPKFEDALTPMPKLQKTQEKASTKPEPPKVEGKLSPVPEPPKIASASGIPKSGRNRVDNPANEKDILNNLIIDIEEANLKSHVGTLVLQAKDKLAKMRPFHTSYFEMIMFGGKLKNKKEPNNTELVKEATEKIETVWIPKF